MAPDPFQEARRRLSLCVPDTALPDTPFRPGGGLGGIDDDACSTASTLPGDKAAFVDALAQKIQTTPESRGPTLLLSPAFAADDRSVAGASDGQRRASGRFGEAPGLSSPTLNPFPPYYEQMVREDCYTRLSSSATLHPPPGEVGLPLLRPGFGAARLPLPMATQRHQKQLQQSQDVDEQQPPASSPYGSMAPTAAADGRRAEAVAEWRVRQDGGFRIFLIALAAATIFTVALVVGASVGGLTTSRDDKSRA